MQKRVQLTWMLAALLFSGVFSGCASRRATDILEARLREQEDVLYTREAELQTAKSELEVANREMKTLRRQLADRGDNLLPAEESKRIFAATGIQLNKLRTGGIDQDNRHGDDMLTAVIVPHDAQGDTVKVAGAVQIRLFDLSQPADQQLIGQWRFDQEEASENWHRGLLGAGYSFRLPWQKRPKNSKLLLHARLTSDDGRSFDISEPINVVVGNQETAIVKNNAPSKEIDLDPSTVASSSFEESFDEVENAGFQLVEDELFEFDE